MPFPRTLSPQQIRSFRKRLLGWFAREKRTLPWRGENDPYRILVSEIMLQQTRVAVVEQRYKLFLRQFPTAEKLARAREQTVLAAWSGLGYYRRARALHAVMKTVVANGGFPRSASALEELPGVGRYTAAAVASIAFGEPVAVVDGNVKRVLGRMSGRKLQEDENWELASCLLDRAHPGVFNQAMMELGALICLPGKPQCEKCPLIDLCAAPGALASRPAAQRRKAVLTYTLAQNAGHVLLRQRPPDASLMPSMWELPECADSVAGKKPLLRLRHSITSTDYTVLVFPGKGHGRAGTWVPRKKLHRIALTGLAKKVLATAGFATETLSRRR